MADDAGLGIVAETEVVGLGRGGAPCHMAGLMVAVGPEDVAKVIIEGLPIWYRPSCSPVCVVELVPETV